MNTTIPTVGAAINQFIDDEISDQEYSSIKNWNTNFGFLKRVIPPMTMVTQMNLQCFKQGVKALVSIQDNIGYSAKTLQKRYGNYHRFFEYCCDRGWIKQNPLIEWRIHRPTGKRRKRLPPTTIQLDEIQSALVEPWLDIFIIFRNTGLRAGELLNNGIPSHKPPLWKGNRIELYSAKIKEWQSQPIEPDDYEVKSVLNKWKNERDEIDFGAVTAKDFWEILRAVNRGICEVNQRREQPNLGYYENLHAHDLRRWSGQEVRNEGTLDDAQAFLRHKRRSTTEEYYAQVITEEKKARATSLFLQRRKRKSLEVSSHAS